MATFNPAGFTLRAEAPQLIGGVSEGTPAAKLVEVFGNKWRRTPVKGVWCVTSPGLQFTVKAMGDSWDFAAYHFDTVEEFRAAFENSKNVGLDASYFQMEPGDKYSGIALIRYMQRQGML